MALLQQNENKGSNKRSYDQLISGDQFGVLRVEEFVTDPNIQKFQLQNLSNRSSKRTKRKNKKNILDESYDDDQQNYSNYNQNNDTYLNIFGYLTPQNVQIWQENQQHVKNACLQGQQQNNFRLNLPKQQQSVVNLARQDFILQGENDDEGEEREREGEEEGGTKKKTDSNNNNFNMWLKIIQSRLYERAELQGFGGQKAVEISDNFRKFVLQGPQRKSKTMKDNQSNLLEYTQSVIKDYVNMLKSVYGDKLVLDPIVLPTSVLKCYNKVQHHETENHAAKTAEKLHQIRLTNKRYIIYQPDEKEGNQWEQGLWKIWDTFLEKAGNITVKQPDMVRRDAASVSFNLTRTTWFDGLSRKVDANSFVAKLNLPTKIDLPQNLETLLNKNQQRKFKSVKIVVKGEPGHNIFSTKNISPSFKWRALRRSMILQQQAQLNKGDFEIKIYPSGKYQTNNRSKYADCEFRVWSCDKFLKRKDSNQNFNGKIIGQQLTFNVSDENYQRSENEGLGAFIQLENDKWNKLELNNCPSKKRQKITEDVNNFYGKIFQNNYFDTTLPSSVQKQLIRIPISNSGYVKNYKGIWKKMTLKQTVDILRKINRQVSQKNKQKSNLRIYLTDGTIPLLDDDDPGHRCLIDRMAAGLTKCRVFDTKRGESLSHFMMMESTGVATYTFFAPLAGISNLTVFHQETKKRRSFNLGANDFIVQPLLTVQNINRVERVHQAIYGRHIRHHQLLPLEFYLEENIPLVLHLRENDGFSSMVELPEQSTHAFITFGDVLQAENQRQAPSGFKVSCNDMDLMYEIDSMYFLERLCRMLGHRGWDKGPLDNSADDWVTSDYFRLYPRTLPEDGNAPWDDTEKPWYEEMQPDAPGCDLMETSIDASNTFVELIVVRTAEKLLDVVDMKIQGCHRYSGQLLSASQALKALENLLICLQDMVGYAVSQSDLNYFHIASSFYPSVQHPSATWFSREYLLHLINTINTKINKNSNENTIIINHYNNGEEIYDEKNNSGEQFVDVDEDVSISEETTSNSLVLKMSQSNTSVDESDGENEADTNSGNSDIFSKSKHNSEIVPQKFYDLNHNCVFTKWTEITKKLLQQQKFNFQQQQRFLKLNQNRNSDDDSPNSVLLNQEKTLEQNNDFSDATTVTNLFSEGTNIINNFQQNQQQKKQLKQLKEQNIQQENLHDEVDKQQTQLLFNNGVYFRDEINQKKQQKQQQQQDIEKQKQQIENLSDKTDQTLQNIQQQSQQIPSQKQQQKQVTTIEQYQQNISQCQQQQVLLSQQQEKVTLLQQQQQQKQQSQIFKPNIDLTWKEVTKYSEKNSRKINNFIQNQQNVQNMNNLEELRQLWLLSLQLEFKLAFQNDLMEWKSARNLRVEFEKQMDVLTMNQVLTGDL